MERFTNLGLVDEVIGRGGHKSAIRMFRGPQVDLMVDATRRGGPVPHPLHRVEGAQRPAPGDRPRQGLEPVRVRLPEDRRGRRAADRRRRRARTFATEAEAYAFLDLPYIEPELREDAGEIEAARAGRLPTLITQADLRGDCHTHWSGATGTTRSRRWPRPAGAGATPTRS